jgi:hypothetical protein
MLLSEFDGIHYPPSADGWGHQEATTVGAFAGRHRDLVAAVSACGPARFPAPGSPTRSKNRATRSMLTVRPRHPSRIPQRPQPSLGPATSNGATMTTRETP